MAPENQIYQRLDRIERKLDANTDATNEGFERINGRVKKLERTDAFREGLEKGLQSAAERTDSTLRKIVTYIGIPATIITMAAGAAALVATLMGIT
jgi:hypothetical protein